MMTGIRKKLLTYTLLISVLFITPLIMLSVTAHGEITEYYKAITSELSTSAEIRELLQSTNLYLIWLTSLYIASILILIMSGIYLVNRILIRPIKELTHATRKLSQGQYDIDLPNGQKDEVGDLTASLRILKINLQTTLQRQERESISLNNILIKLQASEQRSNEVFNNVQDGLMITNSLGILEAVNPALCHMTGYHKDELLGHNVEILIPESYRSKHQQQVVDFIFDSTRTKRRYMKVDGLHKDKTRLQLEISFSQFSTNDKQYFIAVMHDISDKIKAERALLYERDRAQSYLDTAEVAIVSINKKGLIILVNRKACELLGYSEPELLGVDFFRLCPDKDVVEEIHEAFHQHITQDEMFPKYFYINLKMKNGQTKTFEWHNNSIKDFEWNTAGIILAGTDMTEYRRSIDERKALRERLHQAQKMEAVGQLSSGIAHDFNNLLATMMGYTELLQDKLSDTHDESVVTYLNEVYNGGERAQVLIEEMLKYSRGNTGNHTKAEALYIPAIEDDLMSLLQGVLSSSIDISFNIHQDAYPIAIDSVNLQQIIMNLSLNASDAMHKNGRLLISTDNLNNYSGICNSCGQSFSGDVLKISITDTGSGIESETMTHLFEPLFTTKIVGEVGKAEGMGLAVVHGLVHDVGGHIIVNSRSGVGSTFEILIPATTTQAPALRAQK